MGRSPDDKTEADLQQQEIQEWLESLDYVLKSGDDGHVRRLLRRLQLRALESGVEIPFSANTPYLNTIARKDQPIYPGNHEVEWRLRSLVRWNAMAMVVRANRAESGIGGHISTFASAATLYEVAYNHFFQGKAAVGGGDQVYFQGHAAPGIYARAYLEGRLSESQLGSFRRELNPGGGLSSYPHPWLLSGFWEFPTVSMGLGPLMAIHQARFNRYLEDRGLKERTGRVWCFLGDGETDEPEALGAIGLAGREKLDNLIFVVNCNLQRLDGPVRGNGKIIQELEGSFRGAGWNVLKVIWGGLWDPLVERDTDGLLARRMEAAVDGDYQKYSVESGAYIREHFFGVDPKLKERVAFLTDEQLQRLNRGGHDPEKVYAAFDAAIRHRGAPTVILAKTIKGYGLGEAGEGKNITHQQKKLNEEELRRFRARFAIPIPDDTVADAPFYRPPPDSPEIAYLRSRREALGGPLPERQARSAPIAPPSEEIFAEFLGGSAGREASTTMVFVRILSKLLRDPALGPLVVPIVPDEARTFGMEALFRQVGIYSHVGQKYEPVDKDTLLYYREARDGQILEEGINEAGAISSFIAAGTAYATHGIPAIPFFIFYSMFGFQRVGDLIWAAADMRTRGFLLGGTAGRTTLAGEGLQHQDGHSHLLAYPQPNLVAYDPAFAFELAIILREGLHRMYVDGEDRFYYITLGNEPYAMPAMPEDAAEGILRGLYRFRTSPLTGAAVRVNLLGSGSILNEALKAAQLLESRWGIAADVWSVTSYKALHRDALETDRWNRLHPALPPRIPWVSRCLEGTGTATVAAHDYMKALPCSIASWIRGPFAALGTDGFGRSDSRAALRNFFEVDSRHMAAAALGLLARQGKFASDAAERALKELEIDPESVNPWTR